jgi:hypothetical protein
MALNPHLHMHLQTPPTPSAIQNTYAMEENILSRTTPDRKQNQTQKPEEKKNAETASENTE